MKLKLTIVLLVIFFGAALGVFGTKVWFQKTYTDTLAQKLRIMVEVPVVYIHGKESYSKEEIDEISQNIIAPYLAFVQRDAPDQKVVSLSVFLHPKDRFSPEGGVEVGVIALRSAPETVVGTDVAYNGFIHEKKNGHYAMWEPEGGD